MSRCDGLDRYRGVAMGLQRKGDSEEERRAELARKAQLDAYTASLGSDFYVNMYGCPKPRKEKETMLDMLKRSIEPGATVAWSVEAMIELAAHARGLAAEYEAQEIPAPKWLKEARETLARGIEVRHRQDLADELRRAERELEDLRSQEEKRAAKEAEVKRLRHALNQAENP